MSVKEKSGGLNRRGFLKGVAVTGSAAAAATVVNKTANAGVVDDAISESAEREADGYRETPHILEYYEKARF